MAGVKSIHWSQNGSCKGGSLMKAKLVAAVIVAALAAPVTVQAQGIIGGGRHGAAVGHRAAGPVGAVVGAVVGGAVGGVVGGVKGVIGVPQHTRYARRYR
jgi:hypothetical protein